jgi:hypothetical protein
MITTMTIAAIPIVRVFIWSPPQSSVGDQSYGPADLACDPGLW